MERIFGEVVDLLNSYRICSLEVIRILEDINLIYEIFLLYILCFLYLHGVIYSTTLALVSTTKENGEANVWLEVGVHMAGLGKWKSTFLTNLRMVGWENSNPPTTHHSLIPTDRLQILMVSTLQIEPAGYVGKLKWLNEIISNKFHSCVPP